MFGGGGGGGKCRSSQISGGYALQGSTVLLPMSNQPRALPGELNQEHPLPKGPFPNQQHTGSPQESLSPCTWMGFLPGSEEDGGDSGVLTEVCSH